MSNRILDYPEATAITSDDYILLDNAGTGAKCIKASALNINMDNYTIKEARGAIASFDDGEDLPLAFMGAYITAIQEGSGDPSPSNIRQIIGWDEVNVTRCGKNLCGELEIGTFAESSQIGSTYDEMKVANGARIRSKWLIPTFNNNIVISCDFANYQYCFCLYDANKKYLGQTDGFGSWRSIAYTPTTPSSYIAIVLKRNDGATITSDDLENCHLQVELGTTATTYEPYNGNTYSLTFTDGTNPLTVYGGYVDLVSGVLTVNKLGINVMSQEKRGWQVGSKSVCYRITLPQTATSCTSNQTHGAISNMMTEQLAYYGVSRPNDLDSINFAIDTSGVALAVYDTDLTLTEQQMISKYTDLFAVYPLATPLTYQLSKQQIKSLVGENNFFANTGDSVVDYRKLWLTPEM